MFESFGNIGLTDTVITGFWNVKRVNEFAEISNYGAKVFFSYSLYKENAGLRKFAKILLDGEMLACIDPHSVYMFAS